MPNINLTIFAGHLVRDPELRVTPKGTSVCQFTIGNSQKWKDESGQEKEDVCFLDCTAFGKTGEVISKYFQKGSPILVRGKLKLDQWEDKQSGQKRSKIKCSVEGFDFVGDTGKRQNNQQSDPNEDVPYNDSNQLPPPRRDNGGLPPPPQGYSYAQNQGQGQRQQPPQQTFDEDVPF